eukprot:TRINITY_DN6024_c0_g1_i1.p1 TRINITY_DN6024_c0_g1~~TRINITY_DN6024_c0_g1_i1.p1  ORF type:complete len:237 (+),score=40.10 TRINITY_DN6024_c0_g1_i1:31-711(+)
MTHTKDVTESVMELLMTEAAYHYASLKEDKAEMFHSLDSLGFRAGNAVMERMMKDKQLMQLQGEKPTEAVKLICRDFWSLAFKKQTDGLKMNKQGTYILKDKNFNLLKHITHQKEEVYQPGMRGVITAETTVDGKRYTPGTKMVITKIVNAKAGAEVVECVTEGVTMTLTAGSFEVDSPARINPEYLLYIPAGMLRGALYAIGVIASVKPHLVDRAVEFTVATNKS